MIAAAATRANAKSSPVSKEQRSLRVSDVRVAMIDGLHVSVASLQLVCSLASSKLFAFELQLNGITLNPVAAGDSQDPDKKAKFRQKSRSWTSLHRRLELQHLGLSAASLTGSASSALLSVSGCCVDVVEGRDVGRRDGQTGSARMALLPRDVRANVSLRDCHAQCGQAELADLASLVCHVAQPPVPPLGLLRATARQHVEAILAQAVKSQRREKRAGREPKSGGGMAAAHGAVAATAADAAETARRTAAVAVHGAERAAAVAQRATHSATQALGGARRSGQAAQAAAEKALGQAASSSKKALGSLGTLVRGNFKGKLGFATGPKPLKGTAGPEQASSTCPLSLEEQEELELQQALALSLQTEACTSSAALEEGIATSTLPPESTAIEVEITSDPLSAGVSEDEDDDQEQMDHEGDEAEAAEDGGVGGGALGHLALTRKWLPMGCKEASVNETQTLLEILDLNITLEGFLRLPLAEKRCLDRLRGGSTMQIAEIAARDAAGHVFPNTTSSPPVSESTNLPRFYVELVIRDVRIRLTPAPSLSLSLLLPSLRAVAGEATDGLLPLPLPPNGGIAGISGTAILRSDPDWHVYGCLGTCSHEAESKSLANWETLVTERQWSEGLQEATVTSKRLLLRRNEFLRLSASKLRAFEQTQLQDKIAEEQHAISLTTIAKARDDRFHDLLAGLSESFEGFEAELQAQLDGLRVELRALDELRRKDEVELRDSEREASTGLTTALQDLREHELQQQLEEEKRASEAREWHRDTVEDQQRQVSGGARFLTDGMLVRCRGIGLRTTRRKQKLEPLCSTAFWRLRRLSLGSQHGWHHSNWSIVKLLPVTGVRGNTSHSDMKIPSLALDGAPLQVFPVWHELAEVLPLRPLERHRLAKAATGASVAATSPSSRQQFTTFGPEEDSRRYRLLEAIGTGATSRVHMCVDTAGNVRAVKRIGLSRLRRQGNFRLIEERLHQEIAIHLSLQHAKIVGILDVVETEQELCLVLEHLSGGSLDQVVARGPLKESQASHVFRQIAEGLQHMHTRGFAHGDLKPANILLSDSEQLQVKLADFGHSKVVDDVLVSDIAGTPLYMAPELFASEAAQADARAADLWSLGVILFELLTGHCPFSGTGVELQQARHGEAWGGRSLIAAPCGALPGYSIMQHLLLGQ
ncbi:par-1 [Symbiodinium sp. CCMP2456]|nr:par-1 [Symbiodinium sp. CCMP2456]